jgi:hypothetical protein
MNVNIDGADKIVGEYLLCKCQLYIFIMFFAFVRAFLCFSVTFGVVVQIGDSPKPYRLSRQRVAKTERKSSKLYAS